MTFYRIYVYLHVLGVLGTFVALGVELVALRQLARAGSLDRMQEALALFRINRPLGPIAALLVLVPGLYMTQRVWSSHPAWIGAGFVSFVLVAVLGAAVSGRTLVRLEREVARESDAGGARLPVLPLSALYLSFGARLGLLAGAAYAMVVKPELGGCVAALFGGLALGMLAAHGGRIRSARIGTDRTQYVLSDP